MKILMLHVIVMSGQHSTEVWHNMRILDTRKEAVQFNRTGE